MADFYTQFSCIFDVGTAENTARANMIREEFAAELDLHEGESLGFNMQIDQESGPGALWLYSDDCGSPEHVIRFVLRCAADLKLGGLWGFTWSHSCSKPRIDAFGGGAHVLDLNSGTTIADIDCNNLVYEHLARAEGNAETGGQEEEGPQP